ncbi:PREDICTED: Fc receptor-like protein 1 [Myotis davidii]|uniref:Fc receptor-like protein 1 n=1 Tax=Myotis davidii TaxID=225400 RepID=UPI000767731C|nr:PREDICTED: Fc receptor-like protein 1 [Myotis davidii]
MLLKLLLLLCGQPCEPTALLLTVSPPRPIEGNAMTLTCKTQLSTQKLDVPLQFFFFKDGSALGLSWNNSSELQITALKRRDSGSYWCEAQGEGPKVIRSRRIQIVVQGVPVYNVSLATQPPGGHVMEGEQLALVCMAAGGTGDITFRWYRGALGSNLGAKTQRSLMAGFEIPAVSQQDAEAYYCSADNGYGPSLSGLVSIAVRIPVSQPVLTVKAAGPQQMVGDVVELHCEARSGSPPIQYQFFLEDVPLGNSSVPFGGGASLNLSLTPEHCGNYSCEADNGRGAQRSEAVPLHVTGRRPAKDPSRSPPSPPPREFTYVNATALVQQQPIYENVNVVSGGEVYSLVYHMQQERRSAAGKTRGSAFSSDFCLPGTERGQVQALERWLLLFSVRSPMHSLQHRTQPSSGYCCPTWYTVGPEMLADDPSALYSGVKTASISDDDYEDAI